MTLENVCMKNCHKTLLLEQSPTQKPSWKSEENRNWKINSKRSVTMAHMVFFDLWIYLSFLRWLFEDLWRRNCSKSPVRHIVGQWAWHGVQGFESGFGEIWTGKRASWRLCSGWSKLKFDVIIRGLKRTFLLILKEDVMALFVNFLFNFKVKIVNASKLIMKLIFTTWFCNPLTKNFFGNN